MTHTIEQRPDHLLLTFEGNFQASTIPEFAETLLAACRKYRPSKMLCDMRKVTGELNTMERYALGRLFSEKFIEERAKDAVAHCRFAVVGNEPLVDPKGFAATVAANRGTVAKTTTDLEEAYLWLELEPYRGPALDQPQA